MTTRRNFLKSAPIALSGLAGLMLTARQSSAALTCEPTVTQPEGPFYPVVNQADKDTDLTTVAGRLGVAAGEVVYIEGTVRDGACEPVANALVEIWQACASGRYDHPNDPNTAAQLDSNFQYWGRALTDRWGHYKFKTIIPGSYPADTGWIRPPHVHFRVLKRGYHELITQMYFAGEALNDSDRILQSVPADNRSQLIVEFRAPANSVSSERIGIFDIQIQKV